MIASGAAHALLYVDAAWQWATWIIGWWDEAAQRAQLRSFGMLSFDINLLALLDNLTKRQFPTLLRNNTSDERLRTFRQFVRLVCHRELLRRLCIGKREVERIIHHLCTAYPTLKSVTGRARSDVLRLLIYI